MGVLLQGRRDVWKIIAINIKETIWDVCWFGGKLYLLTNKGVFFCVDGKLSNVKEGCLSNGDFLRISASSNTMWIFGRKKVVQFDGIVWQEYSSRLSDEISSSPAIGFMNDDVLSQGSDYLEN